MEYQKVATAVFTPLEYGAIGLSEEAAVEAFGEASIDVYHSAFNPLEWALSHDRDGPVCYVKVVVDKTKADMPVLGMHYLGPNAGEVIQGYSVAMNMGVSFKDLKITVGIHPTTSEQFTTLKIAKSSGVSATSGGC
jgi:thioredoxin reductase (NADPH)